MSRRFHPFFATNPKGIEQASCYILLFRRFFD